MRDVCACRSVNQGGGWMQRVAETWFVPRSQICVAKTFQLTCPPATKKPSQPLQRLSPGLSMCNQKRAVANSTDFEPQTCPAQPDVSVCTLSRVARQRD